MFFFIYPFIFSWIGRIVKENRVITAPIYSSDDLGPMFLIKMTANITANSPAPLRRTSSREDILPKNSSSDSDCIQVSITIPMIELPIPKAITNITNKGINILTANFK